MPKPITRVDPFSRPKWITLKPAPKAFAAAVDIAAAEDRQQTVREGHRLPDTFAPCSNELLEGVAVELHHGDMKVASRFDANAEANFDVTPALAEQLEQDAFVDVVIHGTKLGRVRVAR